MLFRALQALILFVDGVVVVYVLAFFGLNLAFVAVSFRDIQRALVREHLRPAADSARRSFLPLVSLLVPAYNEGVTIADSLRSLIRQQYPRFEIVICNDGSKDETLEVLKREFRFVPDEVDYERRIATAEVRGFYRAPNPAGAAPGLVRMVLIDKANGGKADALNATLNASRGEYVITMDADSLLVPDAILLAMREVLEDPTRVVAVGTQVGIVNDSRVEDGRVVESRLPRSWISRFQVVEYMRSFAQGRTALSALNALPILSGVFALLKRESVFGVGGFLTRHLRSKMAAEYCGPNTHTVCEDMEIIVRLHRHALDAGIDGRVALVPFPTAWTECPENYRDLGRQRARWYRGLLEVLRYHRATLLDRRFGRLGMFALPYQVVFEALAPIFECIGYVLLIVCLALKLLSPVALLTFMGFAMAVNLALSTLAVLLCTYSTGDTAVHGAGAALFAYRSLRDVGTLMLVGFLSNFGYRQYLVAWQLKGLWDFLRGHTGWDKFARVGLRTPGGA